MTRVGPLLLLLSACISSARSATPELPAHHIQTLDDILSKYVNFTSLQQGSLVDFLLGNSMPSQNESITNLELTYLNYNTFKKILEMIKHKYNNETMHEYRRTVDYDNTYEYQQLANFEAKSGVLTYKALDMMRQSVYTTRERLQDTRFYRQKYGNDLIYQIGIIVGSVNQLSMKSDILFTQMKQFRGRVRWFTYYTHFMYYMIIYEKLLAVNTDVTELVSRAFTYHEHWLESKKASDEQDEGGINRNPVTGPTDKPPLPYGYAP